MISRRLASQEISRFLSSSKSADLTWVRPAALFGSADPVPVRRTPPFGPAEGYPPGQTTLFGPEDPQPPGQLPPFGPEDPLRLGRNRLFGPEEGIPPRKSETFGHTCRSIFEENRSFDQNALENPKNQQLERNTRRPRRPHPCPPP